MPNRMLYAGLITSKKVNQLKPSEFELYIRLILIVDDYGRFSGSSIRVARECWPDREDITSKQAEPWLVKLNDVGLINLYIYENERYLELTNWNQRTRASVSKYPPRPAACQANDGQLSDTCQSSAHVDVDVDVDVYSSEQQVAAQPAIIKIPLIDGSGFDVTQEQVDKWSALYQAVDIMQELRKMVGWCESNPKRRKTKRGVMAFISSWFAREQDKGRGYFPPGKDSKAKKDPEDYGWHQDASKLPDFMKGGSG